MSKQYYYFFFIYIKYKGRYKTNIVCLYSDVEFLNVVRYEKVIFLFILFISSIEINAQWSISPEIGIASVKRNDFGDSWGTGIKAGLGVGYQFQTNLGLKTGLYYATRGYSLGAAFGHYEYPSDDYFHELAFRKQIEKKLSTTSNYVKLFASFKQRRNI